MGRFCVSRGPGVDSSPTAPGGPSPREPVHAHPFLCSPGGCLCLYTPHISYTPHHTFPTTPHLPPHLTPHIHTYTTHHTRPSSPTSHTQPAVFPLFPITKSLAAALCPSPGGTQDLSPSKKEGLGCPPSLEPGVYWSLVVRAEAVQQQPALPKRPLGPFRTGLVLHFHGLSAIAGEPCRDCRPGAAGAERKLEAGLRGSVSSICLGGASMRPPTVAVPQRERGRGGGGGTAALRVWGL